MSMTNYLEKKIFEHTLRGVTYEAPSGVYLGLATAASGDGDSVTEASGASYSRQSITFFSPTNGSGWNSNTIEFPKATETWGNIKYGVVYDADVSGNALYISDPLSSTVSIASGDTPRVQVSGLVIDID